jgi:A/G-specific adenine glycosylase
MPNPSGIINPVSKWEQRLLTPKMNSLQNRFQQGLLSWFQLKGRDLPWRKTRDPYKILLSELMLQQTQVDRVIGFYHKFLERFPDFQSVAEAKEEEIIEYWGGLGYYNRARNLQKTAQIIVNEYNNEFPREKENILALPGLGEYTVGAVMSFALDIRAPIVDTNVERVFSRVFIASKYLQVYSPTEKSKIMWMISDFLLPKIHYWEFNQGIMDFGATQCTHLKPKCNSCPFSSFCLHYSNNSLKRYMNVTE